jgi:hypothetical protein
MSPISRGFQGRRRAEADSADVRPGQYVTCDFRQNPARMWRCSMKIVIAGGSGLIGSRLVTMLGATQARCTHRQGPLSEGTLDG